MKQAKEFVTSSERSQDEGNNQPESANYKEASTERRAKLLALSEKEMEVQAQDRPSAVEAFLVEHDFLGLDLADPKMLNSVVVCLLKFEQRKRGQDAHFDVTSLSPTLLKALAEKGFAQDREFGRENQYEAFLKQHGGKPALEVMGMALAEGVLPPDEQGRIESFLRIRDLALTSEDRAIIETRINSYSFHEIPDPVIFIQEEIFENPLVSEYTQNAIAKSFGLTPRRNVTGSDVYRNAGETFINEETGATEYTFTRDQPMVFRDGLEAFTEGAGRRIVRIETEDGRDREVDVTGWPGEAIGTVSEYFQFWKTTEEGGLTHFMETLYFADVNLDDDLSPLTLSRFRQVIGALMGGMEGYDGVIFGAETTKFLTWQLQFFSPKGDAVTGDMDLKATEKNLRTLGIKDKSGRMNLDVLREVGRYTKASYLREAPSFDTLKAHLATVYTGKL